jgi:hypothetical protein
MDAAKLQEHLMSLSEDYRFVLLIDEGINSSNKAQALCFSNVSHARMFALIEGLVENLPRVKQN